MRLIKFSICSLAVSVVLAELNQTSASAFTLDLFTDGNDIFPETTIPYQNVEANPVFNTMSASDINTGLSDVAWGQRKIELKSTSETIGKSSIQILGSPANRSTISSDAGVTIDNAKYTWGSDSSTPLDITDSGTEDSFLVSVFSIDLAGATFTFSVEDGDSDVGSISQPVNSTGNIYFPYETLTTNFPNVDPTRIREVDLEITNAPADFDASFNFNASFDSIRSAAQPVPFEFSPSLGLIFCGGLFGIYKLRKRRTS